MQQATGGIVIIKLSRIGMSGHKVSPNLYICGLIFTMYVGITSMYIQEVCTELSNVMLDRNYRSMNFGIIHI